MLLIPPPLVPRGLKGARGCAVNQDAEGLRSLLQAYQAVCGQDVLLQLLNDSKKETLLMVLAKQPGFASPCQKPGERGERGGAEREGGIWRQAGRRGGTEGGGEKGGGRGGTEKGRGMEGSTNCLLRNAYKFTRSTVQPTLL